MRAFVKNLLGSTKRLTIFFFISGFIVFGNSLFNSFVWDDYFYIINNSNIHNINLAYLFGPNIFNVQDFYRPISALYIALLYTIAGPHAFLYHLMQISLHIVCTIILFILFRKLFSNIRVNALHNVDLTSLSGSQRVKYLRKLRTDALETNQTSTSDEIPSFLAFFLAFFFLIHPINVESVVYIMASQSELYFLFGILSLLLSLEKNISGKRLFLIALFTCIALLAKEIGFLFLVLIICFQILFNRNNLFKLILVECVILLIYLFMRFSTPGINLHPYHPFPLIEIPVQIATLSLTSRLLNIPAIIFYYLRTLVFPLNLMVDQQWIVTSLNLKSFYLPILIDILIFSFLSFVGIYMHVKKSIFFKTYCFFSVWFLIGFILLMQIFPIDMTVADRNFYFPFAGLIGMLGTGILAYLETHDISGIRFKHLKYGVIAFSIIIILLLSVRTIIRNSNYFNEITLYSHDTRLEDNPALEQDLGRDYASIGHLTSAIQHEEKSVQLFPYATNLYLLGTFYDEAGNVQKAQEYYSKSLDISEAFYKTAGENSREQVGNLFVYIKFTKSFISSQEFEHCQKASMNGLQHYPNAFQLWAELSICDAKQHQWKNALVAAEKVKTLKPGTYSNFFYKGISQKVDIPSKDIPKILEGLGIS